MELKKENLSDKEIINIINSGFKKTRRFFKIFTGIIDSLPMVTVTLLMAFGFTMMMLKSLYIPCAILCGVWVFHIMYFVFFVKNLKEENPKQAEETAEKQSI